METLWEPTEDFIESTNLYKFTRWLEDETGQKFPDYDSLHKWSTSDITSFWALFLKYSRIKYHSNYSEVINTIKMPGAKWFEGLTLNYAENIFTHNYNGTALRIVIEVNPEIKVRGDFKTDYSFTELKDVVGKCANALIELGVSKGDRVAGFIANVPEAIIASLACASIGAVWSSASPDFGIEALCERFEQVKPKIVFASTHYVYNGSLFNTSKTVSELKTRIKSIDTIVSVPYPTGELQSIIDKSWSEFLSHSTGNEIIYEKVPFSHPLYIMFSSGTTGIPKCMIHSVGGTLIQHLKELKLHCDIKAGDKLLYYTTTGWMMWNWQISALALGCAIVLYEGSPASPNLISLWQAAAKNSITHLGTSGRYIESCMKSEEIPKNYSLGNFKYLRSVLYTGSPLSVNGFKWIYEYVKKDVHLAGISGGTDIISCFVLGNPTLPVVAGRIQCKGLGVDAAAFNEEGIEVINEPGELVCRKPIPSMPIGFLDDNENKKYISSYFSGFPGVWNHGDYIEFDKGGSSIIHGRSDATLNPGGVRIGVSEIYSSLDHLSYIKGAVAVGWIPPKQSDEVIILFVVLSDNLVLTGSIEKEIRKTIIKERSPKHVPKYIFQISEIPVTRSGKPVELSLKAVLAGKEVKNISAISNPHVIEEVKEILHTLIKQF